MADQANKTDTIDPAADGQDIEQQLDALLEEVDQQTDAVEDSAPAAPPAPPASPPPGGDPLADQIQEMLDEDKARETAAAPSDEQRELADLDEQLAESADDMVAGDFETIEDVLGQTQPEPQPEPEPEPEPVAAAVPEPEPQSKPEPQAPPPPQPVAATPVREAKPVAVEEAVETAVEDEAAVDQPAEPALEPVIQSSKLTGYAMRACAIINKPLDFVSPETRNIIGYVGLLTAFNGMGILIWKALSMFAGD